MVTTFRKRQYMKNSTDANHKRSRKIILGEIIGATNLAAALRKKSGDLQEQQSKTIDHNSFCEVYWDGELVHRTKTVYKRYV